MKTMESLCSRFSRIHPGYSAYLDPICSYPGFYNICIDSPDGFPCWYIFRSCREFSEWMHGVIMD